MTKGFRCEPLSAFHASGSPPDTVLGRREFEMSGALQAAFLEPYRFCFSALRRREQP